VEEADRFNLFVKRAEELLDCGLVRNGDLRSSLLLRASQAGPVEFRTHEPNEEQLRSFLMTFRQFIMDGEPIFLSRVANILWQLLPGDRLRSRLEDARRRWKTDCRRGSMELVVNDSKFPPELVLDLWINGQYFHNDERKQAELRRLDPLATVFVRQLFLDFLVDTTRYIQFLASAIVVARRDGLLS
jgi:hypothetical protein